MLDNSVPISAGRFEKYKLEEFIQLRNLKKLFIISAAIFSLLSSCNQENKRYYDTGELMATETKVDSLIYEKWYFKSGQLKQETVIYINGEDTSLFGLRRYNMNGMLMSFQNDTLVICYDENGNIWMQGGIKNKKLHGTAYFYEDGRRWLEVDYVDGEETGQFISYNADSGYKQLVETYVKGRQIGPTTYYSPEGRVTKKLYYNDNRDSIIKIEYLNKSEKVVKTIVDHDKISELEPSWILPPH